MRLNSARRLHAVGAVAAAAGLGLASGDATSIKPYAISLSADYVATPFLSVADLLPVTGDPLRQFQMIGIPQEANRVSVTLAILVAQGLQATVKALRPEEQFCMSAWRSHRFSVRSHRLRRRRAVA